MDHCLRNASGTLLKKRAFTSASQQVHLSSFFMFLGSLSASTPGKRSKVFVRTPLVSHNPPSHFHIRPYLFIQTAGHYRRYPATPSATVVDEHVRPEFESQCDSYSENYNATADCSHNSWELFQMPIKASYCDAWYEACADDFFCASEGGDFFSCAAEYEECDEGQGNHFAIGSPDDGDKTSSGDGEGGTSVGMAWTSAANLVVALTAVAFVAIV